MGSLFLGVLSGCVARLKEASRRSEEACTLRDGTCARARLRNVMPGTRKPLLYHREASPRTRPLLPGEVRKYLRHPSVSSEEVGFSSHMNSRTARGPAQVRGEDGQVRPCKASRQVFECVVRSMGQVASRVQEALRHACVQVDAPQIRTLPGRALANWPAHRRPLLARGAAAWARASKR